MSRILIVEDMEIFREPIAAALRSHGHKATCAKTGEEALVSLDFSVPDLILLDVVMPGMGGMHLLEQIRSHPTRRNLPVILLTSSGEKESVIKARDLKVDGYILKTDFSLDGMLTLVDEAIRRNKSVSSK